MNKGNTEYLNMKTILPKRSRSGFPLLIEHTNNRLFTSYQTQGRKVKHIFPKKLVLDENFFIGFGLSIGDGLNNPSIRNTHYNFSNSNFKLVHIVYCWLKKYLDIRDCSFQFILFQKNKNYKSINIIKKLFHIKESRIKVYQSDRHRKDVLTIQISNPIFQLVYLRIFNILKHKIIINKIYRRLFLKGLFAAEGFVKYSVYGTIERLSFYFNPKTEKELARFILKCLEEERIASKIKRDNVYVCGYNNMIKAYLTGILSLHKDKRNRFLNLISHKNYNLYFGKDSLKFLRKIDQSKLAKKIGCSQSGVCMMLKRKCISFKNFKKLEKIGLISRRNLFDKIEFIGVANSKIKNKACIAFLKNIVFHKKRNNLKMFGIGF